MGEKPANDLVVLVADKSLEFALRGICSRHQSLGIRPIHPEIITHVERDPGCLAGGHSLVRPYAHTHQHALVVFDKEGCGREDSAREELEFEVEERLKRSGWGHRAAAVVINPELDVWVWSDSPHVDAVLGWSHRQPSLRTWLQQQGYLAEGQIKPGSPKEAFEVALRVASVPLSARLFHELATRVSLVRCQDPAFLKLRNVLHSWFH